MKFFLGLSLGLALGGANPDGVVLFAWLLLAIMIPATIAMGWGGMEAPEHATHNSQQIKTAEVKSAMGKLR